MATSTTSTTPAPSTTATSSCSQGGNRCCYKARKRQHRRGGEVTNKAQGTLFDIPWAIGNFFFFSFHYFVANKVFYTGFIYVTTTLQARGRDDKAVKGSSNLPSPMCPCGLRTFRADSALVRAESDHWVPKRWICKQFHTESA